MSQIETTTSETLVDETFKDPIEPTIETGSTTENIAPVRIGMAKRAIYSIVNEYRKATSFPETMSYYRIAHRDNEKIDLKMKYIEQCENEIEDNFDSGFLELKELDRVNSQLHKSIKEASKDIWLLKNTKVTSADLNRRDRGEIGLKPGFPFRLE